MPKSAIVDPARVRQPGTLKSNSIPLNQYRPDFNREVKKYGKDGLINILRHMTLIRLFETSLNDIKTQGSFHEIAYNHKGPAHLSIGQESASVGQCLPLGVSDLIFGSHRSHGEVLAKCFSAVEKLPEPLLEEIMKSYLGGKIFGIIEKYSRGSIKDMAYDFIIYGAYAEIFAKETGFNKGLGGSMHMFFAPLGSMPNNAIVGGSADIAVGSALFKRINRKPGIVIANIGDGASACGPTWEAMMMASMSQYRTLWDAEIGGAPPLMFNFFNNFYGMGGQTDIETMGFGVLARIGAGVNEEAMHAERVDGWNPLAVADAVERKRQILEQGRGPVLLDTITYRYSGHSPSDASSYRTKEEVALWQQQDAIQAFADYLKQNSVLNNTDLERMDEVCLSIIKRTLHLAADMEISPRIPFSSQQIGEVMFSNGSVETFDERTPDVSIPKEENPRVIANARKSRSGRDADGKPLPKAHALALRDALFEAMLHRFYIDPTMVAFGEENRDWGGAFAVYRGLTEALPYHRLFNAPISEGAIAGAAVGYALTGGRVVAELMYCDFLGRSGDEVFNQMSKWQAMSAGELKMPLVLRVSVGSKYGAQHSQDWTSIVAHIPGLKVMFPATPYDAKGMLNLALRGTDPVVFFESQRLYDIGEMFEVKVPEDYYEIEEGQPAIRRIGGDLTMVTVGATLYTALETADDLQKNYQLEAEVIDVRFINPLNYEKIIESVKKTGKLVLASDACERGSFLHTIASHVVQAAFDYLDGPPVVVGSRNWITPAAEMEDMFFPQKEWIIDAIHEKLLPLPGHQPTTHQSCDEILRRDRLGI